MKICYIFRQKEKKGHSIENVFLTVNSNMSKLNVETELYFRNKSFWKSLFEIKKIKADFYHITGDVHYLAIFLPRKKTTITIHDIGAYKNNKKNLKRYIFAFIWFVLPIWWVKKITVISDLVKQDLIHYFKVNPDKIFVIENPLSLDLEFKEKEIENRKPNILQIGSGWHKNLLGLVESVKDIQCTVTIIGNPGLDLIEKMTKYAIDFKIYSNITNAEVMDLYSECDIVYFASFSEGFGLPIIEAQTIGRPVITSYLSPMIEVGGDGVVLVDPLSHKEIKKAINKLIEDSGFYKTCVEKGLINSRKYTPINVAEKYHQFYRLMDV
ncbi:glycosyltransferase [Flavobacterium salmonis]|uniref:Uncharacterized protein n=1 Tax=Flavobacterium salmonis TaxID=2654844 RepID=A0A6V6YYQ2_9FLAO|nr:glycosyltransferase [Flavobacterium salmonis]CAD0004611.1 hypothetical protein FLAT13_02374 [Flavobacterium salmonis]